MPSAQFLRSLFSVIALGVIIPAVAFAETEVAKSVGPSALLKVGDDAPALKPKQWLQGDPITTWEKDKTYLIECWATWCGPCVAAIPHLNALHEKFKDKGLVVIGMDVAEDDSAKPVAFLKKKGAGMAYRVAFDGGKVGDTAKHWLEAAGATGIPHAFTVRDGKIIWHGSPSELSDEVVATMLSGRYIPEAPAPKPGSLKVGSIAPTLIPKQWLQGEPVTTWAKDKTYIVEFWATWCGPCVAAIPHVNALHNKFKDKGLVVIGVDVQENDSTKPADFLKTKGDGMAYRVAFDGQSRRAVKNWLEPSAAMGIPHTFVVHEGKIIWQGDPLDLNESVVELIITGKFDAAQAHKDLFERTKPYLAETLTGAELAASDNRFNAARLKVWGLENEKRFDEALAALEEFEMTPGAVRVARFIHSTRARCLIAKRDPGAVQYLTDLANRDDSSFLTFVADKLLNALELSDRRDPKAAKVFLSRRLAKKPKDADALLLDAQADYALGDMALAEKTLTALVASTDKNAADILPKAKAALEAVKAGKQWPAEVR